MDQIPLIRASQLKPFNDYLNRIGSPVERLMKQAGLPTAVVDEPDALISYYLLGSYMEAAALSEGIDTFGLRVAKASRVGDIGALGEFLANAPTLYVALKRLIKMIKAHSSGSHFWLNQQSDDVWFCRSGVKGVPKGQLHDEHYTLMYMVNVVRLAAGPRWWPDKIMLQAQMALSEGPQQEAATDSVFSLGKAITAFSIPRYFLALPMQARVLPGSGTVSGEQVYSACSDMPENFAQSLQEALTPYLGEYHPDIELAAEISGLRVRTLQRRLNQCGLTYRELVDQLRFQTAIRLIDDNSIRLSDIAQHVGYSDGAHFNRAFYRWTGVSPSEYRLQRHTGR